MKTFESTYGNVEVTVNEERITVKSERLSAAEAEIVAKEYLDSEEIENDVRGCYEEEENVFTMRFDVW